MKSENAIEVRNVKKRFKVYYDKGNSLKEKMLFWNRNRFENHWVLKGVSFEIKKGEVIGLIGKNGSGKSTTLKMLTRIMYPTEGTIEMKGRVSSLLELGAGFHPDMSGRENIFTNASIFGLNHSEIEERLEDIIRYSELEDFIDNPVRTYSSGMYMRLAFAVAINVDADILLIDEVLAVGDVSFQAKCFEKLQEIKRRGTTIVIVSHTMSQIEKLCDRAIWVEDGVIREDGSPKIVGAHYIDMMEEKRVEKIEKEFQKGIALKEEKKVELQNTEQHEKKNNIEKKENVKNKIETQLPAFCRKGAVRRGTQQIKFIDAGLFNEKGQPTIFFKTGDKIIIKMEYEAKLLEESFNFTMNITRQDGLHCFGTGSLSGINSDKVQLYSRDHGKVEFTLEENVFLEGVYLIDIAIQTADAKTVFDYISNVAEFRVLKNISTQVGIVHLPCIWKVDEILLDPQSDRIK